MDLSLSPAEEAVRALCERLAREVVGPAARRADEERRFDRDVVRALAGAGVLGGTVPTAYGGGGWDDLSFALCCEELGRADASVRGLVCVHLGLVAGCIAAAGSEAQKRRWLPRLASGEWLGACALTEEGAGSDAAAIATRATRVRGGWILDGEKVWITNGNVADLVVVFATTDPAKGHAGIAAFVLGPGTVGLERRRMEGMELGHRGADHARLVLRGVRVPSGALLVRPGRGFRAAMEALDLGRLGVAAGATGLHRACLDAAVEFARWRRQFGRRIGDFQMVQERIADMAVDLEAARLLVRRAALKRMSGERCTAEVSAAKLFAVEAAQRAATEAVLLLGSRGYVNASPVERHYRDVQGLRIYEGTSMVQRVILAREILGKDGGR